MGRKAPEKNCFTKILKRIIIVIGCLVALSLLSVVGLNAWVIGTSSSHMYSNDQDAEKLIQSNDYDCILILGAGLHNGKPSPMLKDRLETGISLYKKQCHLVNQFQIKIQWFSFRESHCFFSSKT